MLSRRGKTGPPGLRRDELEGFEVVPIEAPVVRQQSVRLDEGTAVGAHAETQSSQKHLVVFGGRKVNSLCASRGSA
jgi:hypothetical protein